MQPNKILKNSLVILSVVAMTACSSHKSISNPSSKLALGATKENIKTDLYSEEQAPLQTQELQKENTVYFSIDKYDVSPTFSQMLDWHATFLRNNPSYKITIEGHADERGTPEYNIALGERRANAVKVYLQIHGVFSDQISIVSYGKEKPAALGHEEASYAKNRRALLVY